MLGVSGFASADGAAAAQAQESGGTSGGSGATVGTIPGVGGGGFSEEDKARIEEEGAGGSGGAGNRWPRQETLALLKIRSDMDVVFRDSSLKGPLWEQVSRKMADLGYHRSAKKCKEKFENVYKYHKRTKDGRSTKSEGKTYRFFDQLEALENTSSSSSNLVPQPPSLPTSTMPMPMQIDPRSANANPNPNPPISSHTFVSSTPNASIAAQNTTATTTVAAAATPQSFNNFINSSFPPSQAPVPQPPPPAANVTNQASHQNVSTSFMSNSMSSSSSTSSDEDIERRHKRKRKWKDFFERLMKDVIDKQEELQKRFLETLEKRERDRMIREEAWRVQEMARINREHDLLVQERSMAAARESALVTFLQKFNQQNQNPNSTNAPQVQTPVKLPENPLPQQAAAGVSGGSNNIFAECSLAPVPATAPAPVPISTPVSTPAPTITPPPLIRMVDNTPKSDNGGGENFVGTTSSRWPKSEVNALIELRTRMDTKYQENGPKGPLWEDISAEMRKLGYNRNAKRCKEKWENINKYFKKVKESNKKRPEDSKTCPYFHQLEALYQKKARTDASSYTGKPENPMIPIMARPEQQWPLPQDPQQQQMQQDSLMEEREGDNMIQNDNDGTPRARNLSTEDEDYSDDGDDYEEDDEGSGYEIVTNKPPSSIATTTVG